MSKPKLIEVEWFKEPTGLNEIYQQTGMIFAFATPPKDGYKCCHEWVKCRDFLHDVIRSQLTGDKCAIYGFKFDPKVNPNTDMTKIRMLVSKHGLKKSGLIKNDIPAFRKKMISALALLNHFEKEAKISLSRLQEVNAEKSGKKAVFLFVGPKMWLQSPFLVSMYTFLIRLGDKELEFKDAEALKNKFEELSKKVERGDISDNDATYLKHLWNRMHPIIENRSKLFPKKSGFHDIYWKSIEIGDFHNRGGILSLARSETPDKKVNDKMKEFSKTK